MAPPTDPKSGIQMHSNVKLTTIDLIGGIFCSICNITYSNKKDYDDHYRQQHVFENNSDIWYTCVVCRKDIHGYSSFRGHCYTTHVIKSRFKCQSCSKFFSKQAALDEHITNQHRFKCPPPCNKEFKSKKELKLHQIVHKEDNGPPYPCQRCNEPIATVDGCQEHFDRHARFTYTCPICDATFDEKLAAGQHLTKHFVGEILQIDPGEGCEDEGQEDDCALIAVGGILCRICSSLYATRGEFDLHHSEQHGEGPPVYSCNWCGSQYDRFHLLTYHCYNHVTKHKFKCDTCSKSFPRLSLLVTHTRVCDGSVRPFHCARCPAVYGDQLRFVEHLRTAHQLNHPHPCIKPHCLMTFETRDELVAHERSHRTTTNCCRVCGLEFKTLASCERHLDVHRKPILACPVCEKQFSDKHRSAKHFAQHFTAVLHVCKTCGNVYNAKFRLAQHMKSHAETKRFECNFCQKGFTSASAYQQHLNTHTGHAPYKCVACERSFKSYPNWSKHVRRMHDIDPKTVSKTEMLKTQTSSNGSVIAEPLTQKPYNCEFCNKSFISLSYWVKHLRRTHDIDPKSVKKPDLLTYDRPNNSRPVAEQAMLQEHMSHDENVECNDAATLEEACMYVQSIESESSPNGRSNPTETDFIQEDMLTTIKSPINEIDDHIDFIQEDLSTTIKSPIDDHIDFIQEDLSTTIKSPIDDHIDFIQEDISTTIKSPINEIDDHIDFFSNLMPENCGLVSDSSSMQAPERVPEPVWVEYGPDFMEPHCQGVPAPAYGDHVIDLDDHLLPHIDPHLTVRDDPYGPGNFLGHLQNVSIETFGQNMHVQGVDTKWEPPIITKIYSSCYDPMADINANVLIFQ